MPNPTHNTRPEPWSTVGKSPRLLEGGSYGQDFLMVVNRPSVMITTELTETAATDTYIYELGELVR